MAFVKTIKRGERTYYYLVESIREGKRVRQRYLKYLGTEKPFSIEEGGLNMATETQVTDFWSTLARMYKNLDSIRQASHTIIDYADQIDSFDTKENFEKALKDDFDTTALKKILSGAQKEMDAILSFSHELFPHLKNPSVLDALRKEAQLILALMQFPGASVVLKIKEISFGLRLFTQASNSLILSPSKKSLKYAFGIDVGNEWAKLKAYIETHYSNY
jgi:hypothetical protein